MSAERSLYHSRPPCPSEDEDVDLSEGGLEGVGTISRASLSEGNDDQRRHRRRCIQALNDSERKARRFLAYIALHIKAISDNI